MNLNRYAIFLLTLVAAACGQKTNTEDEPETSADIWLKNASSIDRTEVVKIDVSSMEEKPEAGMGKIEGIPVEAVDQDLDGSVDRLYALVTIKAGDSLGLDPGKWEAAPDFPKKTQAEISAKAGGSWKGREYQGGDFVNVDFLRVPAEHTDHSWYVRYEGPGWENELVGYRAYLDWRNAIDIFGKKVDTLVLQKVGLDGFDSYHEESDWGMDILKAGNSLGIGSIGRINDEQVVEHFKKTDSVTCRISQNGYLSSAIETNYYGWETGPGKCSVVSTLKIRAADRATTQKVSFDQTVDNFCTGIVKHPAGEYLEGSSGNWGYIATYGAQTLFDDNLGMALFYKLDQVERIDMDDEFSYLLVFKPATEVKYQLLGAWEHDPEGIKSKDEFVSYLNDKLEGLNSPISVRLPAAEQ